MSNLHPHDLAQLKPYKDTMNARTTLIALCLSPVRQGHLDSALSDITTTAVCSIKAIQEAK